MAAQEISPIDPKIRAEFAGAIRRAGLILDGDPVMDGMLHRVPVENGKARAKDGTYVGFTDGRPAGFIQNYLSGTRETWTSEGKELSPAEREHLATHAQLAKLQRATDLSVQHSTAAERVQAKWDRLSDAPPREENAYLARKGVEPFGVKYNGDKLVVPARDADGKIWSLQNISAEEGGPKLFEKGGRKTGNFHLIGEPKAGEPILVAEGYATGASLHQASGRTVAVAFDSGNIDSVVAALKKRHPDSPMYVMGDDDHRQKVNVGVEKALGAAEKHQVGVAFPAFEVKHGLSDFNDLHATQGLQAVKAQVEATIGMTMEQSRDAANLKVAATQGLEGVPPHVQQAERLSPSTGSPQLSSDSVTAGARTPAEVPQVQGDRLSKTDVATGAAHVAQLTGAGGEAGRAVAQTVGLVDAARVAGDVMTGKEVRALDVGAAAASVTLTAGVGGAEIHTAAQLVAGSSALDATRRTINTLETGESGAAAINKPTATAPAPQLAPEGVTQAVAPTVVVREAAHPEVDGGALAGSISHRNSDAMAAPRNSVTAEVAAAWVARDVADLSQIKDDGQRADALFKIGQNTQEYGPYKGELARQDPEASRTAVTGYMEVSAHLIAIQRDIGRSPWLQEHELAAMGARHADLKREGTSIEQLPKDRVETIAREDVLSMQRLRGDEREPAAYRVVAEALKSEPYRESFSRELRDLPVAFNAADMDDFTAGKNKRYAIEANDVNHLRAVERRSDDLQAVVPNGIGASVARDMVRLDLEALRSTEGPLQRMHIVERMAANSTFQGSYKEEVARQDPEISRSVGMFVVAGRSVYDIARTDQPHVTGSRPANQPAHDDWALPILTKGTFASERQGQLTPVPVPVADFKQTLLNRERPYWDTRDGYVIPAAPELVGDFRKTGLDTVAALARSRGMLLEDDPVARYIKAQAPAPDRVVQPSPSQAAMAPANAIEQRSREQQYDDAGTIALRKRIADSNATVLNDPAKLGAGDRTLETLGRMTRKELEAFEQAIKRGPDQVQTVLSAAQKRIEGDVELRVGREPIPPLNERYNIIPHLTSRDYHFRDKPGTAFTEGWLTLKSSHESADVIKGMLDRADQRGWTAVNFSGSPEFKRQAWIAATARGIKGVGHTPTDGDRAAADNERKRLGQEPTPTPSGGTITRAQGPDRTIDPAVAPAAPSRANLDQREGVQQAKAPLAPGVAAPEGETRAQRPGASEPPVAQQVRIYLAGLGESPANIEAIAAVAASKLPNERVYVGLVTARDYAPYEFKEHAKESPYVKLKGPEGEKTIWGVDLPRALDDACVKLGDSIALEFRGMRAVSVPVKDLDKAGQVVGWHDETVNRNTWFASKVEDLRAEALKPTPTPSAPSASAVRDGVPQQLEAVSERKAPDRLASQPVAPTPLPVVGTMPTQPPAHAPTGAGGLDAPAVAAKQAQTHSAVDGTSAVNSPASRGKDADAPALAAFDAALKQKNVPAALHEPLREIFGRELAVRQARGESMSVSVYDPAAKRETPRLPPVMAEPQQVRVDHKISR